MNPRAARSRFSAQRRRGSPNGDGAQAFRVSPRIRRGLRKDRVSVLFRLLACGSRQLGSTNGMQRLQR